jgi:hypothetical protein
VAERHGTAARPATQQPRKQGTLPDDIKSGAVTLAPGIYYLQSGGRVKVDGGSLSGTGVMIFDGSRGDNVLIHSADEG